MASFAYLNCDGLEWIDRVVFGAASSAARAREVSPPSPVRQPSLAGSAEKFVPVSGPSETSPMAPGRTELGQKLLAPDILLHGRC